MLESLDNGKPMRETRDYDIPTVINHVYHHAGWAQLRDTEMKGWKPLGMICFQTICICIKYLIECIYLITKKANYGFTITQIAFYFCYLSLTIDLKTTFYFRCCLWYCTMELSFNDSHVESLSCPCYG